MHIENQIGGLIMKKPVSRFALAGKGEKSCYFRVSENGTIKKQNPISNYKVLLYDEHGCRQFPNESNHKIVIDCGADDVNSVFEGTTEDGKTIFKPFHGLVILFCVEKKKNGKKCHFLWRNMLSNNFQYARFSCFGFEDKYVYKISDFLFSNLIELLTLPLEMELTLKEEKIELETEPVLIMEE